MAQKQKNVLLVDDEKSLLFALQTSLVACSPNLAVFTAEDGREAVRVLDGSSPIDVVVTDLKMPGMDGFELIIHLKGHFPEIPVIVMTGIGSAEVADRLRAIGPLQVLEKPFNIRELAAAIFRAMETAPEGKIHGVTLAGFLQLVAMEEKTCTLKVQTPDKAGVLYIRNGDLIDAKSPNKEGEWAAFDILSWEDARIEMASYGGDEPKRIEATLGELLLEAFRIKDESARDLVQDEKEIDFEKIVALDEKPRKTEGAAGAADSGAPRRDAPVIDLVDRKLSVLPPNKEKPMAKLRELLSELSRLQGVSAVCLVGFDGLVIDSVSNTKMEAELVGAIASSGIGASESIGRELGRGTLEVTMLEFEHGPVIIAPVGKEFLLVIVAAKDASLGMLRLKIRKLGTEIEAAAEAV